MLRTIFYKGDKIRDESLIVGNHGSAHLRIDGNFKIRGLIHCPGQTLRITIRGQGTLSLHGVCRHLELRSMQGECMLDFQDLKIRHLQCGTLDGKSILKIGEVKYFAERSVGEGVLMIESS